MVFLNSLTQNSISDGYIRQLFMKLVGTELMDVRYDRCEFFGRIGVAIGADSIFIYDSQNNRVLRCAKTGELLYVEKEGDYYYVYFLVEDSVVVDQVALAKDNFTRLLRRNVVINSKFPIANIYSTADYINIVDVNNNFMCVDKNEIRDSDFVRVFRSIAFTVSEEDLTEEPGFFASIFGGNQNVVFKVKTFNEGDYLVSYISCGNSEVYKCFLDKRTLRLMDYIFVDYLSGIDTYNLEALHVYDKYIENGGNKYYNLISCNIDGRYSVVTVADTEETNRHLVLDNDTYECVVTFITDVDFILDKALSSEDKFLCFDFSDSENRQYILVDKSGGILTRESTTMSDDVVVKLCLLDSKCTALGVTGENKDEVIVEDDEESDIAASASFDIEEDEAENEDLDTTYDEYEDDDSDYDDNDAYYSSPSTGLDSYEDEEDEPQEEQADDVNVDENESSDYASDDYVHAPDYDTHEDYGVYDDLSDGIDDVSDENENEVDADSDKSPVDTDEDSDDYYGYVDDDSDARKVV